LPSVGDIPKEKIQLTPTNESLQLIVEDLLGKNYKLSIDKLFSHIIPD